MNTATFLTLFLSYWVLLCACCALVVQTQVRRALVAAIPCLFAVILAALFNVIEPWQRLWLGTVGLLFTIKATILLLRPHADLLSFSKIGLLIYMSAWPGMDPQPFDNRVQCLEDGTRFVRGYIRLWLGLVCVVTSALAALPPTATNWMSLIGILLMIHFGYADMLSCALRLAGWDVQPLFDSPLKSCSLRDFWSKRWNLAFVEMDKIIFLPLARRFFKPRGAILAVFIVSGLLHEIGISYASGQSWGLPLIYFLIQGAGILIEKRMFANKQSSPVVARIFTYIWILAPLPLLFNAPFQNAFIAPVSLLLRQSLSNLTPMWLLSNALWLAAAGHFGTTLAGLQVPFRLHWKEELGRLRSFNRKIMLYCAAYVGLAIIAFGSLTFVLHEQFLTGDKVAVSLALLISLFWIARLLVDCFFFSHSDWPKGPEFVIGHTLLNTLFVFLSCVYSSVVLFYWPILLSNSSPPAMLMTGPQSSVPGQWAASLTPHWLLSQALWLAAIGNFCALIAGAQMPFRLDWKEDLSKLSTFNRKIMINYVAYVFMMIMSFGMLTFTLHDRFMAGEKSAVCLALVIALFWILRLMVDCFYFRKSDWPKGSKFVVGHRLLNMLFIFQAVVYSSVVVLNWLSPNVVPG